MKDILKNDSLENFANESSFAKKSSDQDVYHAYLIKNIKHIKKMIADGAVKDDVESIVDKIFEVSNGEVSIPLTLETYAFFGNNDIVSKRYGLVCTVQYTLLLSSLIFGVLSAVFVAGGSFLFDYKLFTWMPILVWIGMTVTVVATIVNCEIELHEKIKKNR